MSLPLTPEMLAAAYELLRTTPPFARWKLPHCSALKFIVSKRPSEFARYYFWEGQHHIEVSIHGVGHTRTLIEKMAHEMIHLYLQIKGWESKSKSPNVHNAKFRKFAAQFCRWHGFDLKGFF